MEENKMLLDVNEKPSIPKQIILAIQNVFAMFGATIPKNVVVASTMLVLGLGGAMISIVSGDLSITISGMSLAAIIGILLNLCLRERKSEEKIENKKEEEKEKIKV